MKYIILIGIFLKIALSNQALTTLYTSFEGDVYHYFPNQTAGATPKSLGVSYGISDYNGDGIPDGDHSMTTFISFDTSSLDAQVAYASLDLYVEPVPENDQYGASFSPGTVGIYKAKAERVGYFNAFLNMQTYPLVLNDLIIDQDNPSTTNIDESQAYNVMDFDVNEQGVWVNLDITNLVNAWIDFTEPNYGLIFTAYESTATRFASSLNDIPENQPSLKLYSENDLNLKLNCTAHNQFTHLVIGTPISIDYQWSTDLINWHANNTSDGTTTIEFITTSDSNLPDGQVIVTALITGNTPESVYYRAISN